MPLLMSKILKIIGSKKLALFLIFCLALYSTIGILWFPEMFSSSVLLFLGAVFSVNLGACTFQQVLYIKRLINYKPLEVSRKENFGVSITHILIVNRLGNLLFHIGFLVVVAGALMYNFFSFTGKVGLLEGQMFSAKEQNYTYVEQGSFAKYYKEDTSVFLHNIKKVAYTGERAYATADISLLHNGLELGRKTLEEGESLDYRQLTVSFYNFGYFVDIAVKNQGSGEHVQTVGLDTIDDTGHQEYTGIVGLSEGKHKVQIEFLPDIGKAENTDKTESYRTRNPALYLVVQNQGDQNNRVVFEGSVRLGQWVEIEDGLEVSFKGFRPWGTLLITTFNGYYTILTGTVLIITGLVLRYMITSETEDGVTEEYE